MKYASIDVGTNTVLLLVVHVNRDVRDILDISTITRLGQGLRQSGFLSAIAMERAYTALKRYKDIIRAHGIENIHCVGTSALREAGNSREFLTRVREELGIPIKIISERKEAYYTYLSVKYDELIQGKRFVIVDIGGGSTEIIKGTPREFVDWISVPAGAVKLTEMFIRHDPPTEAEIYELVRYARRLLNMPVESDGGILIGTGGTITNIASMMLGLEKYEKEKIHTLRISQREIGRLIESLKGMTTADREAVKGLEKGREDIILQGIVLLKEIMSYFGVRELTVSAKGVRYGVIYERLRM